VAKSRKRSRKCVSTDPLATGKTASTIIPRPLPNFRRATTPAWRFFRDSAPSPHRLVANDIPTNANVSSCWQNTIKQSVALGNSAKPKAVCTDTATTPGPIPVLLRQMVALLKRQSNESTKTNHLHRCCTRKPFLRWLHQPQVPTTRTWARWCVEIHRPRSTELLRTIRRLRRLLLLRGDHRRQQDHQHR